MHLMSKFNKKVFAGFTLAEVLITLVIIGIVVALTLPTLINNYQKTEYVTALKKFYASTNQALVQMATDYGCTGDLYCTGIFGPSNSNEDVGNIIAKYFKIAKNCYTTATDCWPDITNKNFDGSGNTINMNSDVGSHYDQWYKFLTVDNMSVMIGSYGGCNSNPSQSRLGNGPMTRLCAVLHVDINGYKGPNRWGRDTFQFFITNGNGPLLYPEGGPDDNYASGYYNLSGHCDWQHIGDVCAARIINEGWQMSY